MKSGTDLACPTCSGGSWKGEIWGVFSLLSQAKFIVGIFEPKRTFLLQPLGIMTYCSALNTVINPSSVPQLRLGSAAHIALTESSARGADLQGPLQKTHFAEFPHENYPSINNSM